MNPFDWLIRTYTPMWLELAGLDDEAQQLRELRLDDPAEHKAAAELVREVRRVVERHTAAITARVNLPVGADLHVGTAVEAAIDATVVAEVVAAAWTAVKLRDSWTWDAWEDACDAAYAAAWAVAWAAAAQVPRTREMVAAAWSLADVVVDLRESAIVLLESMVEPAELAVTA